MKKINLFYMFLASLLLLSCDDYLDVNQNENAVLYSNLTNADKLSAAQNESYRLHVRNINQLGNVWTNAWAGNNATFASPFANEYNMNVNATFNDFIWNIQYRAINNFQRIIETPNVGGVNNNYIAAARICKVFYMQYLVDLYGDLPYTEAFKETANVTPKYNDDQFVYRKLIGELETAKGLIASANPNAEDISATDIMLAGVMTDWYAFANTIELKMLLRMSNNTGATAAWRDAKMVNLAADVAGFAGYLNNDVSLNPGYLATNDNTLNPFYNYVSSTATGTFVQNRAFLVPSGHSFKSLSLNTSYSTSPVTPGNAGPSTTVVGTFQYPNVADPRRTRIYGGNGRASTQGYPTVDVYNSTAGAATTLGRVGGLGLLNPYNEVPAPVAVTDLLGVKSYVITKAEINFLKAEAALRGYTGFTAGQAVGFYNTGIDESFNYLTAGLPAAYKTAIGSKVGYSLTAGTTFSEKLQGLMYQKWVALIGINGIESFIDYTRTGFPITPLAIGANRPNKPLRLFYPNSEYIANSANVPALSDNEIFTVNAKSPFWLQGDPALGN